MSTEGPKGDVVESKQSTEVSESTPEKQVDQEAKNVPAVESTVAPAAPQTVVATSNGPETEIPSATDGPKDVVQVASIEAEGNEAGSGKESAEDATAADDDAEDDDDDDSEHDKQSADERQVMFASGKDYYCWTCHKEKASVSCKTCPRSFHSKCLTRVQLDKGSPKESWSCPECRSIAEGEETRRSSPNMSRVNDEEFSRLLRYALGTIKPTSEPSFHTPVSDTAFPDYKQFIIHPMDFSTIEKKVRTKEYRSTDALLADVKWIYHNCYIYNNGNHPLTKNAGYFLKVTKNEMSEIEVCTDCFNNYYVHSPAERFTETCSRPHTLVWARLKGHPFWPAKVVRVDLKKREADCRFFGDHNRAWISLDNCLLLSEGYEWTKPRGQKSKLDQALEELKYHIEKLDIKYPGLFKYAAPRTPLDPLKPCLTDDPTSSADGNVNVPVTPKVTGRKTSVSTPAVFDRDMSVEGTDEDSMDDEEKPLVIASPSPTKPLRGPKKRPSSPPPSIPPPPKPGRGSLSKGVVATPVSLEPAAKRKRTPAASKEVPTPQRGRGRVGDEPVPPVPPPTVARVDTPPTGSRGRRNVTPAPPPPPKVVTPSNNKRGRNATPQVSDSNGKREKITPVVTPATPVEKSRGGKSGTPAPAVPLKSVASAAGAVASSTSNADLKAAREELEKLRKEYAKLQKTFEAKEAGHKDDLRLLKENMEREVRLKIQAEHKVALTKLEAQLNDKYRKEMADCKRKQWCASCLKEAIYFCCWNTAYCGLECQSAHWPLHMSVCQQSSKSQGASSTPQSSASTPASSASAPTKSESNAFSHSDGNGITPAAGAASSSSSSLPASTKSPPPNQASAPVVTKSSSGGEKGIHHSASTTPAAKLESSAPVSSHL